MERILTVARYIAYRYKQLTDHSIDEMKLHKLLYFAQRESLAITGEPLFENKFEGWKLGPVCPEVRNRIDDLDDKSFDTSTISGDALYIVNSVIDQYGGYESWKLSALSHEELSWQRSRIGLHDDEAGHKSLLLDDIKEDAKKVRPYDPIYDMYYDEFEDQEVKL